MTSKGVAFDKDSPRQDADGKIQLPKTPMPKEGVRSLFVPVRYFRS